VRRIQRRKDLDNRKKLKYHSASLCAALFQGTNSPVMQKLRFSEYPWTFILEVFTTERITIWAKSIAALCGCAIFSLQNNEL
jgi:hypothetical protein